MRHETVEKIREQIDFEQARQSYPEGFPALPEIPGSRYTEQSFYDLEMSEFWSKTWLCAIRAEEIPEPGCYKLFNRINKPIIIVRGRDNQIRAFFNTCRHRGAPIVQSDGKRNLLTCKYHSWTYDLEGSLKVVPEEYDFGDFDKGCRGLLSVRCEEWDGWIFVNFDDKAPSLKESLASVLDDLSTLNMQDLSIKGRLQYKIKCNWKAAYDAFLEAYHVKSIHPETVAQLLDTKGTAIGLYEGGHTRMVMPKRFNTEGGTWGTDAANYDIPSVPKLFRENNAAFGIFPNFVSPFDSGGFPFIMFWPDGKDDCIIDIIAVGAGDKNENADNSEYWSTFIKNYDAIMHEDIQFLEDIQASLNSGAFTGMQLCYQERRIYWIHEEIDRTIGIDKIPEEMRVAQVLGPFAEGV